MEPHIPAESQKTLAESMGSGNNGQLLALKQEKARHATDLASVV
jgi:hypothetical protein